MSKLTAGAPFGPQRKPASFVSIIHFAHAAAHHIEQVLRKTLRAPAPFLLTLPPVFILVLALAMFKRVDHDEHQFIASGALLARRGLLPYRDYPYFHVPNLAFVYAALDRLSPRLLLNARLFNCLCSACTISIIASLAFRWFERIKRGLGTVAIIAVIAASMLNPIFEYTSGRAWNHDLPVLLTLGAVLCLWQWRQAKSSRDAIAWASFCGILIGLAAGTRLTFAPVAAPFLICIFLISGQSSRSKWIGAAAFIAGAAIALLPSWTLLAIAPRQFWFGNFQYPMLNTQFRLAGHYPHSMDPGGKFLFLFTDIFKQPGNLVLLLATIIAILNLRRLRNSASHPHLFEAVSLLLVSLTLFACAFAATPLWVPYFYAPIPFAILFVARVAADERMSARQLTRLFSSIGIAVLISMPWGLGEYRHLLQLPNTASWAPNQTHKVGRELAEKCRGINGPIFTYAPIVPLEGRRSIYPEFATGPFAARVGDFVDDSTEALLHVVDDDDRDELLRQRPAAGIFTGYEGALETPLVSYAKDNGFKPVAMPSANGENKMLWINPNRTAHTWLHRHHCHWNAEHHAFHPHHYQFHAATTHWWHKAKWQRGTSQPANPATREKGSLLFTDPVNGFAS